MSLVGTTAEVSPYRLLFLSVMNKVDDKPEVDRKKKNEDSESLHIRFPKINPFKQMNGRSSSKVIINHSPSRFLKSSEELFFEKYTPKYKIEKIVGEGAVSLVYKARHLENNDIVAIKVTKHSKDVFSTLMESYYLSVKLLSVPHLPKIYESFGNSKDRVGIVCEYLGECNVHQQYLLPNSPKISLRKN